MIVFQIYAEGGWWWLADRGGKLYFRKTVQKIVELLPPQHRAEAEGNRKCQMVLDGPIQVVRHNRPPSPVEIQDHGHAVQLADPRVADLERELTALRKLLALGHGCRSALYGDDGELQCHECGCDFRRNSVEVIERRIFERNLRRVEAEGRHE